MIEYLLDQPLEIRTYITRYCERHETTFYNLRNARTEKSKQLRRGLIKALNVRFGKLDDLHKVFGMSVEEMRAV